MINNLIEKGDVPLFDSAHLYFGLILIYYGNTFFFFASLNVIKYLQCDLILEPISLLMMDWRQERRWNMRLMGSVTNQIRDYWKILQKSNAIKKQQHEDLNAQDLQNIFSSEMGTSLA